jgi:glycosyltransferase involved in cell wall biosynthesis
MYNKIISIIIATYNASDTILECLDSIENEINSDCELIIIDGNSSDNTLDLLNKKKELIDVLISEPDKGIYDAWNKGIEKSKGKWIMFLGADDLLLKNSLLTYLEFLRERNSCDYDYVCAQNEYINLDGKFIKYIGKEPKWKAMKYYMPAAHVASLHNKKLFDKIGFFNLEYKICADYELLSRKKNKLNYKFIDYKIAKMKTGGMSFSVRALTEQFFIRRKHLNIIINVMTFLFQTSLFIKFKIKNKIT